jgi:arylsulfatase A-like enzyme
MNEEEIWEDGRFFGDLMVEECLRFIEKNRAKPFFLYWAINMPHYPLQGTAKWRERYRDLAAPRRMYAEFVSTLDEGIGQVIQKIDQLGLRDETLIIFQSDHGHSVEERTFGGGGNAGPFRGAKASFFEGGIRVPSIVSMPGTVPEGGVRSQMVTGCDWLPTIAEFCDVSLPETKLDGKSIYEVIRSPEAPEPHGSFYWQLSRGPEAQWAVREGNWKLLGNPRDPTNRVSLSEEDKFFLVNLAEDISERKNLAVDQPEVLKRLIALSEKYREDLGEKQ